MSHFLSEPALKTVVLESPFAGNFDHSQQENIAYARKCMRDSILVHKESPLPSHLLYAQPYVLNDARPDERRLGIQCGDAWRSHAMGTVVYVDYGITSGVRAGIRHALMIGNPIQFRSLRQGIYTLQGGWKVSSFFGKEDIFAKRRLLLETIV